MTDNYKGKTVAKRTSIKQLLNRKKIYTLAAYRRKVSKQAREVYTFTEILSTLKNLAREGKVCYTLIAGHGNTVHIVGHLV